MFRAWLLLFVVSGCQCLVPVDEGAAATSPPAVWCGEILESVICDQAQACSAVATGVSCEDLVNERGNHYGKVCGPRLFAALDAGVVIFDADAARACTDSWRTVCGADNCISSVFRGTLAASANCRSNLECLSGYCAGLTTGCQGQCAVRHADGADSDSSAGCARGSAVSLTDGGLRCRKREARGAECRQAVDEVTPAPCEIGLACRSGTCLSPLLEGSSCTPHDQWSECVPGTQCDRVRLSCTKSAEKDEPCGVGCLQGLGCDANSQRCVALPIEGRSCASTKRCASPFACKGDQCVRLGSADAGCSNTLDCEGAFVCRGAKCRRAAQLGGGCADVRDCERDLQCVSNTCVLADCR